jgi:hypothetical protein
MREYVNIYWNNITREHHVLVYRLNEDGTHKVRLSEVIGNVGTIDNIMSYWVRYAGREYVKVFTVSEYFGKSAGSYAFVAE